jgi:hypothetical protein
MGAKDIGPEYESEEHRARWIDLGLGAASVAIPEHWTIRTRDISEVTVAVAELPGATFTAELRCHENGQAIRSNDLERFLIHPHGPPLPQEDLDDISDGADGQPDFEQLTVHYGCTEGGRAGDPDVTAEIDIWRRIHVLRPDHIRTLEFRFHTPLGSWDDDAYRRALVSTIRTVIREASVAETVTPFDRVAPNDGLKLCRMWGCIYIRVPEAWQGARENPDGTGMYVFDDKEKDRWTLWVDFNSYAPDNPETEVNVDGFAHTILRYAADRDEMISADLLPARDPTGEAVVRTVYASVEDGTPLRHTAWHKITATDGGITISHFTWVVPEEHLEDEDIQTLTDLVEREVCNALVVARHSRE